MSPIDNWLENILARNQEKLKLTGVVCESCSKPGASATDEAYHNTGDCGCHYSLGLCWKEWWGVCQKPE